MYAIHFFAFRLTLSEDALFVEKMEFTFFSKIIELKRDFYTMRLFQVKSKIGALWNDKASYSKNC